MTSLFLAINKILRKAINLGRKHYFIVLLMRRIFCLESLQNIFAHSSLMTVNLRAEDNFEACVIRAVVKTSLVIV